MRVRTAIFSCALTAIGSSVAQAQVQPAGALPPADLSAPTDLDSSNPPSDQRHNQLQAAQANAETALRDVVLTLEVGRGLHVRDVVDRSHSADGLARALSTARPLGGPRWVDEQTCQVQMAVSGSAVADAVAAMVDHHPEVRTSISNAVLNGWRRTAFSATGSSAAGGAALQQARPPQADVRWAEVSDDDRRRAVAAAQADAVHQASDDLRRVAEPLSAGPHARVIDALDRPAVVARVREFLNAQPVTRIEFLDNLTVSLSMTVDSVGLGRAAQRAVADDQPQLSAAAAAAGDWKRFRAAVAQAIPSLITGSATAAVTPVAPNHSLAAASLASLPAQPPEWVDGTLTAEGSSGTSHIGAGGRLKAKGLADAAAVSALRTKLLALRLGPTSTLGDAARADPQVAAAVSRVLLDARDIDVTFRPDGTVAVRVDLKLHDAWELLRSNP